MNSKPSIVLKDGQEIQPHDLRKMVTGALDSSGGGDIQDVKFLEVMLVLKHIAPSELKPIIQQARNRQLSLADEAMAQGIINDDELTEVLSRQFGISMADLTQERVDLGFAQIIDSFTARELGAIPIRIDRKTEQATILITRPDNLVAREEIPLILNLDRHKITWLLTTPDNFEEVIVRVFENDESASQTESLDIRADSTLDSRASNIVTKLVSNAQTQGASDIHFERLSGRSLQVRYRIDDALHVVDRFDFSTGMKIVGVLKGWAKSGIKYDESRRSQEASIKRDFGYGEVNLRMVTLPTPQGEEIVLRILDNRMTFKEFSELGLSGSALAAWEANLKRKIGMIIVTGPTGSGKTTTLYAAIKRLATPDSKIITLEDPVETDIQGVSQIGIDTGRGVTFANQLSRILRADPDILMIGEIRDEETASISIEAALTGHLVLTTLHTKDAVGAITRLADMGVERFLLSDALSMITAQRLMRKLCVHCRVPATLTTEEAIKQGIPEYLAKRLPAKGASIFNASARGCSRCREAGYRGRIGIHEAVIITERMSELIAAGASTSALRAQAQRDGAIFLLPTAFSRILEGETDFAEFKRVIAASVME